VPYPDDLLHEDEELLVHCHPHWSTVVAPVTGLLAVVAVVSFASAAMPPGPAQGALRLAVLAAGAAVAPRLARPLLRWGTTHLVLTTDRIMQRHGLFARRRRDLALARVTAVSYEQSPAQRLVRSGTLVVGADGRSGAAVLAHVPRVEEVHGLLEVLARAAVPPEPVPAPTGEIAGSDRW
jgi:uncharacterized membrane protein YdbT with pleckstrin-like domain